MKISATLLTASASLAAAGPVGNSRTRNPAMPEWVPGPGYIDCHTPFNIYGATDTYEVTVFCRGDFRRWNATGYAAEYNNTRRRVTDNWNRVWQDDVKKFFCHFWDDFRTVNETVWINPFTAPAETNFCYQLNSASSPTAG